MRALHDCVGKKQIWTEGNTQAAECMEKEFRRNNLITLTKTLNARRAIIQISKSLTRVIQSTMQSSSFKSGHVSKCIENYSVTSTTPNSLI